MDTDLRKYLQRQRTWKENLFIAYHIIEALYKIHCSEAIHRDLHSGNILFNQRNQRFEISDLGFYGPADKSPKSIYGNLPYIALGMLMVRSGPSGPWSGPRTGPGPD